MKNKIAVLVLALFPFILSGCEFIGDIFKTGVWVGVIIVIAVVAVIAFIAKMFTK